MIKHSSGKNDGSRHAKTYECRSFSIFFHIFSIYHPTIWESFWVGIPKGFSWFFRQRLVRNGRSLQEEMQTRGHKERSHSDGSKCRTWVFGQTWVWVNTYRYIFSGMNIHLPAILGFTRYQGFDPSPLWFIYGETTALGVSSFWPNANLIRTQWFLQLNPEMLSQDHCRIFISSANRAQSSDCVGSQLLQGSWRSTITRKPSKTHKWVTKRITDLIFWCYQIIRSRGWAIATTCHALHRQAPRGSWPIEFAELGEWICREPRIRVKDSENMYGCKLSMDLWIQATLSTFAVQFQTPTGDGTPIDPSNQDQGAVLPVPGFSHVYLPHSRRFAGSCSFKLSVGWWRSVWTWVCIMIFSMISAAQVPCMVVYAGSSNLVVPWQGWGFPCLALKTARLDRSFPMRDCRNQPPGPSVGI